MRFHRNYEQLQLWRDPSALSTYASIENLVAARLEPVIRQLLGHSVLDIIFRRESGYLSVPMILLDSPQVVWREADRFVWPEPFARAVSDEQAIAIEEFLFPWLRSISLGRSLCSEHVRHFGTDEDRAAFEEARRLGFVGAAPLEESARALAPYVYGSRYAYGKNAAVTGAKDGLQGAAYIARVAAGLTVQGYSEGDSHFAASWFPKLPQASEFGMTGIVFMGTGRDPQIDRRLARDAVEISIDVLAGDVARRRIAAVSYPVDVLFTWDELHAPKARDFSVFVPEATIKKRPTVIKAHDSVGGSAGRILIGLRSDWQRAPDSDVDSALELAGLLRAEGFSVDVTGEASHCDFASYDVAHWFNLVEAPLAAAFLIRAKSAGLRTILTATFTDVSGDQRQWGTETNPVCFKQEFDEASIADYLSFVRRRALLAPDWEDQFQRRGPVPEYDAVVKETLALCDAVIAESESEAALLRSFGYQGDVRVVPPFLPAGAGPEHACPPVGFERFALVHAPIEPRQNQLFAIRGAREAGMPLVLAGSWRDMDYASRLRECADDSIVVLDPSTSELAWLYAHADVIADFSWYGYGTARLHRAMLSGSRVCFSSSGWAPALWPQSLPALDPAVPESFARGLKDAQAPTADERVRMAYTLEPTALLRNVLAAYVGAQAVPV